ncbi:MAG: NifB/NifX family molybdenum-iron cluster-binding protein [Thermoplasmata archaeon]|nr:NifB/NifX family molybdenum-iron cluster-binding protein [Thermoplasmata archaeon]
MKICIPTMGGRGMDEAVGEHFGRVPTYTIVDNETGKVQVIQNNTTHMGGSGYAPDLISGHGANIMLCGGLGRKAIQMFEEKGIMVYVGATGTVADAIGLWKAGKLQPATNETACQQHAFRGEGHGDGHGEGHHHHD